jgi:uroporphyrin-III C-methyltransferase
MTPKNTHSSPLPGLVTLAGAGPGDPGLLTLAVARALAEAQVVLHDRLVSAEVLALAGPQALLIETGKQGYGPSMSQADICAMMVAFARSGRAVLRLKSGDPAVFGRLDEEIEALAAAGLGWRMVTGHDVAGYCEADWHALARPGAVAAVYMGRRAARFWQGRLLMHGADPATPVSIVENASRPDQRILAATLATLPEAAAEVAGPAVLLWGLAPRAAAAALPLLRGAAS